MMAQNKDSCSILMALGESDMEGGYAAYCIQFDGINLFAPLMFVYTCLQNIGDVTLV